jgi:histidinol phosphatase-like enzyme
MSNNLFKDNFRIDLTKLYSLQNTVAKILKMALEVANVYIVTNAAQGWVEHSVRNFFPDIKDLLKNIRVISARTLYENKFPKDMMKWKTSTYLEIQKFYEVNKLTNLICIGDSPIDMYAGKVLARNFKDCYFKSIKFKDSPQVNELDKQLCLVISKFSNIFQSQRSISIKVEKKIRN